MMIPNATFYQYWKDVAQLADGNVATSTTRSGNISVGMLTPTVFAFTVTALR